MAALAAEVSSPVTAVLDLRERATWDVTALLAPTPDELWGQQPLVPLGALVQVRTPHNETKEDEPVVGPGSVDTVTGDVRTRRGRGAHRLVLRVGNTDAAAHLGDVLVPQLGDGPCVLIGEQHRALTFVNFVALRPEQPATGLWLWAALSSARGRALRRTLTVGTTGRLPLTALLNTPVPVPLPPTDPCYAQLSALHARTSVAVSSEGRSWWRVTTLPVDGQWHRYLVTPTPEVFNDGVPLRELATIIAGRNPPGVFEQPRPGALPVLNGRSVDGNKVQRWAEPGTGVVAEPGDVAVVEVGVRGRAALVTQSAIAGTGVLLVKPHDRSHGEALAAYLRSEPAQTLRGTLITGGVIPRLSRSTLAQLPVPHDALSASGDAHAQQPSPHAPLSEQLEQLLWN
ncbi:restriction endonuclease subunit S [Actinosynnema sp. NPDC049800]